jgi:cell division protein FtsQ
MTGVALPADRRFRRARAKPARRRSVWRAAVPLLRATLTTAVLGYAAYLAATVAIEAQVLQVDRIAVHGNRRLTDEDVQSILAGLPGRNLITTNLEEWRARLLASPWIVDAELRRTFPSTVNVAVIEREPVAAARLSGDLYLIDALGVVIDRYGPEYAELDLPIVDGVGTGAGIDEARAALAGRLLSAVRTAPDIVRRVSQVDVTDLHNASVLLTGDSAVVWVGEDRFLERLRSYIDLSAALKDRVPDVDYVDLRFDDRMYVGPRKGVGSR